MFLPAAGYYEGVINDQGDYGSYWSSTPYDDNNKSYRLVFRSDFQFVTNINRGLSISVRAVLAEEPESTTTGTAKATINSSEVDVNWVQLWEDGPKFAEFNVGAANNKAEDYGGYYAWGGNQDKVDDHNTGTDALEDNNDTATKLWGTAWRMPKKEELEALLTNCDVEWTTVNGVNGRLFTGKDEPYKSNSVFLPAAGYCNNGNVRDQGSYGYYWSSTPDGKNYAYYLNFNTDGQRVKDVGRVLGCCSVRAVLAE